MNNFKYTSKLRIFAIISAVIIVAGMALGTVFHVLWGKFFNYEEEFASYKSVTVSYVWVDINGGEDDHLDIGAICDKSFKDAGVKPYYEEVADTSVGEQIEFGFTQKTDTASLEKAVNAINAEIKSATASFNDTVQSRAVLNVQDTVLGDGATFKAGAIALAVVAAVQIVYMLIRFGLSAMYASLAADFHNLALYAALLALCRIPLNTSSIVFGGLLLLATVFGTVMLSEGVKRARKDEANAKLGLSEVVDISAARTFKTNLAFTAFMTIIAVLAVVFGMISALNAAAVLSPVLCAVAAFAVAIYGNTFFTPAVFPVFKKFCDKFFNKPSQKKGN